MYRNYLNAVEDVTLLANALPPDSECQPVGEGGYPEPMPMPQCPPCECKDHKKFINIFWIVVITVTITSFIMGGEDKALTGGNL